MKPFIGIFVKGGCVIGVDSTEEIDIVIVDYDNIANGDYEINILEQDTLYTKEKILKIAQEAIDENQ